MIAVYRLLYPWDFLYASIASITDVVDKIYIFVDNMPWGGVGATIEEQVVFRQAQCAACAIAIGNPKVVIMGDHVETPLNQFTHLANDRLGATDDTETMVIEPDMVFRADQLASAVGTFHAEIHSVPGRMTRQVEVWKGLRHRVPERPHRTGVVFWRGRLPETLHQANVAGMPSMPAYVHNFGFAVSEGTMRVKDSIARRMSSKIGDCLPDPAWLDKWLHWKPGDKDLEISLGYQSDIPEVVPYTIEELPELVRHRVESGDIV